MDNFEKSNKAVLLVHGIAGVYVQFSDSYLMDQVARLNAMNSMMIYGVTDEQLKRKKEKLSNDAMVASEGIQDF